MKTDKRNENYEFPQVEIIEVMVEKGFVESNGGDGTGNMPGGGEGWN